MYALRRRLDREHFGDGNRRCHGYHLARGGGSGPVSESQRDLTRMTSIGPFVWTLLAVAAATHATAQAPTPPPASTRTPARPDGEVVRLQNGSEPTLLDRLRAELAQPGAEGKKARQAAIEHLLSLPDERAHAVLRARLSATDDPDQVRLQVLDTLSRHLRNPIDPVFGELVPQKELRLRIVRAYAETLAIFWFDDATIEGVPGGPLGALAREVIVRMPARVLVEAFQQIVADAQLPLQVRLAAIRAAGDTQDLLFASMLADHVAADDQEIRFAARTALRYLTFHEATFESKEQFVEWQKNHEGNTYVELAEDAARRGARRERLHLEELAQVRRAAAAEVVRALTEKRKGVDWPAVQTRTLGDDVEILRVCLEQLRTTLQDVPASDEVPGRTAFARALVQRYRQDLPAERSLRGLLLEVLAAVVRPGDTDLAAEVSAELLTQLASAEAPLQLAALRALKRYPSPEARAAVVAVATTALQRGPNDAVLAQALQTLATGGETPWRSPLENAPERAQWLQLIRTVCTGDYPRERRNDAIAAALQFDRENKRQLESFDLLLEIANDQKREADFRTACLIQLQVWRDHPTRASVLVQGLARLLGDPERDVRLFAADSLARLPDASEDQKRNWLGTIVAALRERLQSENNPVVLRAMLACLVATTREPGTPESAIGALNVALETIGLPVPEEQQARTQALLQTLTEVAADPRASQGQWVGACETLLRHERRRMLRHVLVSHNAVQLGREIRSADAQVASRARSAVRFILLAALLKPQNESWTSTEELRREASDVRTAFESIPPDTKLPESVEDVRFRLLRLEVLVATDALVDAIAVSRAWLEERDPAEAKAFSVEQLDTVRFLLAEALLRSGKPAEAVTVLGKLQQATSTDPRMVDVADKLGRAFVTVDARKAVEWLSIAIRGTAEDSAAFRSRLVALWQARIAANPAERTAVLAEVEKRSALFDAPDCPEELKQAVATLKGPKGG